MVSYAALSRRMHHTVTPRIVTPLRFGMVGLANTATDVLLFLLLTKTGVAPPAEANAISYAVGIAQSFLINKSWTFRDPRTGVAALKQFVAFATISGGGLLLTTAIVYLASPALTPIIAKAIAVPAGFAWGYGMSRSLVFDHRR